MTRDDIIRMAREAGMPEWLQEDWFADPFDSFALRFAALVAAAEREECALILDNCEMERTYTHDMAKIIRARGQ